MLHVSQEYHSTVRGIFHPATTLSTCFQVLARICWLYEDLGLVLCWPEHLLLQAELIGLNTSVSLVYRTHSDVFIWLVWREPLKLAAFPNIQTWILSAVTSSGWMNLNLNSGIEPHRLNQLYRDHSCPLPHRHNPWQVYESWCANNKQQQPWNIYIIITLCHNY